MTIGQVQEDCMDGGSPRGFFDLHLCGALPAVADIVADRVVEQHAVLRNDADRGAQASLRHLRDVLAVYGDTAASRLIEAEEEPRQGRLARARGADDGEHRAGPDVEVDALEDRPVGGVTETRLSEADQRRKSVESGKEVEVSGDHG